MKINDTNDHSQIHIRDTKAHSAMQAFGFTLREMGKKSAIGKAMFHRNIGVLFFTAGYRLLELIR